MEAWKITTTQYFNQGSENCWSIHLNKGNKIYTIAIDKFIRGKWFDEVYFWFFSSMNLIFIVNIEKYKSLPKHFDSHAFRYKDLHEEFLLISSLCYITVEFYSISVYLNSNVLITQSFIEIVIIYSFNR